jgi:hypothetical protein
MLHYLSDFETLRRTDHHLKSYVDYAPFWHRRLQKEFGLSLTSCNFITKDQKNPGAALRIVYQRLALLKARSHPERPDYRYYYNAIIKNNIDYPPLFATGPAYPIVEPSKRLAYLYDAIRFKNIRFAEHILLQLFPDSSETKYDIDTACAYINYDTVNVAVATNNIPLLERMQPSAENTTYSASMQFVLSSMKMPPLDETSDEAAHQAATNVFHQAIIDSQPVLATHLILQKKVKPDASALGAAVINPKSFDDNYITFIYELTKVVREAPILRPSYYNEHHLRSLMSILQEKADIELIETIYQPSKRWARFNVSEHQQIELGFLRCIVILNDLPRMKQYESTLTEGTRIELICLAMGEGRLGMLKHLMTPLHKNTVLYHRQIREAIKDCAHKDIIQYLFEEFKIFEPVHDEKNENPTPLFQLAQHNDWENWLEIANTNDRIDILKYLIHEAPENLRFKPTQVTLDHAITWQRKTIAQYLIERCDIPLQKKHVIDVMSQFYSCDGFPIYLLSQCLDIVPTEVTPRQLLINILSLKQPNDDVNKVMDWLTSPEGIKRGFQFSADDLTAEISTSDSLQMLRWLATKLNITIPRNNLIQITKKLANQMCKRLYPDTQRARCVTAWEETFSNALIAQGYTNLRKASYQSLPSDLVRSIWLFASNRYEDARTLNKRTYSDLRSHYYWVGLLQRDHGLSQDFIKKTMKIADARIIYQRLEHLAAESPRHYKNCYKKIIIDGGVDFFPLFATGPSYPAIEPALLPAYFVEAKNIDNRKLAAHVLAQMFLTASHELTQDLPLIDLIDTDTIDIAAEAKDDAVLKKMLVFLPDPTATSDPLILSFIGRINLILKSRSTSHSDAAKTDSLNTAITSGLNLFANQLLDEGVVPNETTLASVLRNYNYDNHRKQLAIKLLHLIDKHPSLLNLPVDVNLPVDLINAGWDRPFHSLYMLLRESDNVDTIEKVYCAAKRYPLVFTPERLKKIQLCLLEKAVTLGDLATIQSSRQALNDNDKVALTCLAIEHDHVAIIRHFKQLDKDITQLHSNIENKLRHYARTNTVKYLVKEFELFKPIAEEKSPESKKPNEKLKQGLKGWLQTAAQRGDLALIKYAAENAPENCGLKPSAETLTVAVKYDQIIVAQYLIETCKMKIERDHVDIAEGRNSNELYFYLLYRLSQLPKISIPCLFQIKSHSPEWFIHPMRNMTQPNDTINKLLDLFKTHESTKSWFKVSLDTLTSDFDRALNLKMLAWLSAKLNIEIPHSYLEGFAEFIYKNTIPYQPVDKTFLETPQWEQVWIQNYIDAFHAFYKKFREELSSEESLVPVRNKI